MKHRAEPCHNLQIVAGCPYRKLSCKYSNIHIDWSCSRPSSGPVSKGIRETPALKHVEHLDFSSALSDPIVESRTHTQVTLNASYRGLDQVCGAMRLTTSTGSSVQYLRSIVEGLRSPPLIVVTVRFMVILNRSSR